MALWIFGKITYLWGYNGHHGLILFTGKFQYWYLPNCGQMGIQVRWDIRTLQGSILCWTQAMTDFGKQVLWVWIKNRSWSRRRNAGGGRYIWSMTKTFPMPQANPSWDDWWSNPLQFASAIKKAYFPTILKPPYLGPICFLNSNIKLSSSLPLSLKVATAIQNDQSYQLQDPSTHVLRSTLQLPDKATENKWL